MRIRVAQTRLRVSTCVWPAASSGRSHTVFLREDNGTELDRLDSHIWRALDLRTLAGDWVLAVRAKTDSVPESIRMITPQSGKSGYWTKVLTNTFALASCVCGAFCMSRPKG